MTGEYSPTTGASILKNIEYLIRPPRFDYLQTPASRPQQRIFFPTTNFSRHGSILSGPSRKGWLIFLSVFLEKAAPKAAMFGIFRHERQGIVDEETRQRTRLIAPHIQRAVLISKVIDLKQGEAASLAQAFDGLRAGVILVDLAGRVVHANAAAHALLSDGRVLRVSRGRLVCDNAKADLDLQAVFAAAALGDCAIGTKGIPLPTAPNIAEPYVAHVLPLVASERRRSAVHHAATAAVFVHKAALEAFSPPEVMAEIFKLTMTELRVLFAIVEVGGVPEVARVLGIAPSTVRTHLAHVYDKTGVARQADLVKLVAGFVSPLRLDSVSANREEL